MSYSFSVTADSKIEAIRRRQSPLKLSLGSWPILPKVKKSL